METPDRNPQLWHQAKTRAKFKSGLLVYLFVNVLLWAVWALTGHDTSPIPWPLWATAFWGLALAYRGLCVYGVLGFDSQAEREYERLVRQQEPRTLRR